MAFFHEPLRSQDVVMYEQVYIVKYRYRNVCYYSNLNKNKITKCTTITRYLSEYHNYVKQQLFFI